MGNNQAVDKRKQEGMNEMLYVWNSETIHEYLLEELHQNERTLMLSNLGYPNSLVQITLSHVLNSNGHMNINCVGCVGGRGKEQVIENKFIFSWNQLCDFIY